MIGQRQPIDEAWAVTRENRARLIRGADARMGDPVAGLQLKPKFKVARSDRVFTIGSCFARNVEHALSAQGVKPLTTAFRVDGAFYEQTGLGARNGALNAFTPGAIETMVSLPDRTDGAEVGFVDLDDGRRADMLVSGVLFLPPADGAAVRNTVLACYNTLPTADVVIITLGYTEQWFDAVDGVYVNRSPGAYRELLRKKDRFYFHNASAVDVGASLDRVVAMLEAHNPNVRIILTVSPVRLHGTFTAMDVITANLYSKATLLTNAVAAAQRRENVDYFPSYEMVTLTSATDAWEEDGVHVKPALVSRIMARFIDAYVGGGS